MDHKFNKNLCEKHLKKVRLNVVGADNRKKKILCELPFKIRQVKIDVLFFRASVAPTDCP